MSVLQLALELDLLGAAIGCILSGVAVFGDLVGHELFGHVVEEVRETSLTSVHRCTFMCAMLWGQYRAE